MQQQQADIGIVRSRVVLVKKIETVFQQRVKNHGADQEVVSQPEEVSGGDT